MKALAQSSSFKGSCVGLRLLSVVCPKAMFISRVLTDAFRVLADRCRTDSECRHSPGVCIAQRFGLLHL